MGSSLFEDGGAFVGGGSGGEDVVDEEDIAVGGEGSALFQRKSSGEIFEALFAAEGRLGSGVAGAAEQVAARETAEFG